MSKTSFERRFDGWMQDPEFVESYRLHRARIDAIDTLMRALDERERQKMTKADLARRIEADSSPSHGQTRRLGGLSTSPMKLGFEITIKRRRPNAATRSDVAVQAENV